MYQSAKEGSRMTFSFTIPTYRPRDVGDCVNHYRSNFDAFGHQEIPIIIFDDSKSDRHHDMNIERLRQTVPKNTFYVGPAEKSLFREKLVQKLGAVNEETLRRLLRPSYGGNRNHTVLYTLGEKFMSVDDDMRPWGIYDAAAFEGPALKGRVVLRGHYVPKATAQRDHLIHSSDLVTALLDVLGHSVGELPMQFARGETLIDSMTDPLTNMTLGGFKPNTITLSGKSPPVDARVVTAQTYRSGSPDLDAADYVKDFLVNPANAFMNDMSLVYIIDGLRPAVTSLNWRLDCGVSAYDNTKGLPPFIPTRLRFEDYVYRIWLSLHPELTAAHIGAAQTHQRNPKMRPSLAFDLWNEQVSNFMKNPLREMAEVDKLITLRFKEPIHITKEQAAEFMEVGHTYFVKSVCQAPRLLEDTKLAEKMRVQVREAYGINLSREQIARYYTGFANDLFNQYCGFNIDVFQKKFQHTIDKELQTLRATMALWPNIVEAVLEMKESGLPMSRLN